MKLSTKESRDCNILFGAVVIICGLVLAFILACTGSIVAACGVLVFFTAIGFLSFVVAFKHRRDYGHRD